MTPSAPAFTIARTWAGRLTPNPTATGTGETALTSRTSRPTRRRQGRPGAGDADQRDAVEKAAAPRRDRGAAVGRSGRRDEVDDGETGVACDGFEWRAFVRCQVGHDQPGRTGAGQPFATGPPSPPPMTWFA